MKINSKKGFTLIELVIYIGILFLLITVLTDILVSVFNTQLSSQSTSQVAQDGRYIYTRIIYDINRADSVTIPANLGDTSNSLTLSISGANYIYFLSNGNLEISDPNSTEILNSPETTVSNLQFQRIGNSGGKPTFQIKLTVAGKINLPGGRQDKEDFQTAAGIR